MPSQTLGDVLGRVYSRIDNNTPLYPRQDVVDELNDSIKVINLFCGCIQQSIEIGTSEPGDFPPIGRLIYDVPNGMIFPVAVQYESRELTPLSLRSLASQYRSWASDVSSPGRPVKEWAPIGVQQFCIHPLDSLGGRSLIVTGVMEPQVLSNDTDPIPLPNDYVEELELITASVLITREGGRIFVSAISKMFAVFLAKMKLKSAYTNLIWPRYYDKLQGWKPGYNPTARVTEHPAISLR